MVESDKGVCVCGESSNTKGGKTTFLNLEDDSASSEFPFLLFALASERCQREPHSAQPPPLSNSNSTKIEICSCLM